MALDVGAAFRIRASVDGQAQLDRFNQSLKTAGKQGELSAGEIRQAMRTLPMQFSDIAVSLAGGQSPFMVLLQQGTQIRDSFGSVGGAIRGIASLITPAALAAGSLAAAVGAVALAFIEGEAESVNFNRALTVTNNFSGQTADRFNATAQRVQDSASITAGAARELMQAVVASGQYGPTAVEAVTSAMGNLQRVTGLATKEVQEQFAGLSKGAADWASEMNRTYNFLDVAQYRYIRRLEEAGDKEGAMREAAQMLDKALAQRKENLGTLERAWRNVASAAGWAWQTMLNIGRDDTLGEQIAKLEQRLKNADELRQRARARGMNISGESPEINAIRAQLDALRETQRLEGRAADAAATRAAANQKAIDEERKAEQERKRTTAERMSDFDRLRQGFEDQLLSARELNTEETLLAEIQAGRYKGLTEPNRERLLALAREIDSTTELKRLEADRQGFIDLIDPMNRYVRQLEKIDKLEWVPGGLTADQAREARFRIHEQIADLNRAKDTDEVKRLEADRQGFIDLIDPMNRYVRELEKIDKLEGVRGGLTTDQATEARFRIQEQIDDLNRLKDTGKTAFDELADAVNGWGKQATDTFVEFAFGAKSSFSDLVNGILKDIARMMIQKNVTTPLFNAISGMNWAGMFGFADGGIMTGGGPMPLRAYASGGIANSPQLALYGEGSKPEAFVPLPDGRTIPVTLKTSGNARGGDTYNITVPVTMQGGSDGSNAQGEGAQLGKVIASVVRAELINQKRPGGLLA